MLTTNEKFITDAVKKYMNENCLQMQHEMHQKFKKIIQELLVVIAHGSNNHCGAIFHLNNNLSLNKSSRII